MGRMTLLALATVGVLHPSAAAAQDNVPSLDDFSFLAGCWVSETGPLELREYWTEAEAGVMMWTTRTFRDGGLADWEFGMLRDVEGTVTLEPYPRGNRSEHAFPLVRWGDEYVFENLEHDFPVRIVYTRNGDDEMAARIEGSDGRGFGWAYQRTACPGGAAP